MDLKRLFQVLVVGSQMVGCSTARTSKLVTSDGSGDAADAVPANDDGQPGGGDVGPDEATDTSGATDVAESDGSAATDAIPGIDVWASDLTAQDAVESDGAMMTDAKVTSDAASTDARGKPCFCNTTPSCCEAHADGTKGPVAGIECCWATSC